MPNCFFSVSRPKPGRDKVHSGRLSFRDQDHDRREGELDVIGKELL